MGSEVIIHTGKVAIANDRGLKLEGEESWINFSKFARPAIVAPPKGELVAIVLDKSGFARKVDVVGSVSEGPAVPVPPSNGHTPAPSPLAEAVRVQAVRCNRMLDEPPLHRACAPL